MNDEKAALARIDKHEAVCAERYAGINARLRRIEGWFVALVGSTLALLVTLVLRGGGAG
jgi:hypothetical protein